MHAKACQTKGTPLVSVLSEFEATDTETPVCLREDVCACASAQSRQKLKAIWLQLQQLALGLTEKHLCQSGAMATLPILQSGQCEA